MCEWYPAKMAERLTQWTADPFFPGSIPGLGFEVISQREMYKRDF